MERAHPFAHPGIAFCLRGQNISNFWHNVDRCDSLVVREMIAFWHGVVGVNVEFFWVGIRRFQKRPQMFGYVG